MLYLVDMLCAKLLLLASLYWNEDDGSHIQICIINHLIECKNMVVKIVIVNSGWIYVHVPDTYKSCKMNTE